MDDLGYVQQSREEMEVLFTLLAERYERGSVLLTSNLPFSGWEQIFKDPMTTAAAIDRLVHHSVIMELNIPSYRAEQAKKAEAGPAERGVKKHREGAKQSKERIGAEGSGGNCRCLRSPPRRQRRFRGPGSAGDESGEKAGNRRTVVGNSNCR